jgi:N-acetylmuramoyl-L-alanine amidase
MNILRILFISLIWLIQSSALADNLATIQKLDASSSTITFAISKAEKIKIYPLRTPNRLVVDFYGYTMAFTPAINDIDKIFYKNVRVIRKNKQFLQVVFDLTDAVYFKSWTTDKSLTIQLYHYSKNTLPLHAFPQKQLAHPHVMQQMHYLSIQKPKKSVSLIKTIIVIDPGHGGKDPGTIGKNGIMEKNIVLSIAKDLLTLINREENMHAYLTRNHDEFITLRERMHIARKFHADLFVAIHADSYSSTQLSGASVYALSSHGASSEAARWLAKRENIADQSDMELGDLVNQSYEVRSILIDMAQTATISDSLKLGKILLNQLSAVTTLRYSHVEQAPFVVLKSPDITSVLVETGFLSNPKEATLLQDAAYRDKLAQALLVGLRQYAAIVPTVS